MAHIRHPRNNDIDWLAKGPLAFCVASYTRHLRERGYAQSTIEGYLAALRHFSQWIHRVRLRVRDIDDAVVARFVDEHVPRCDCVGPIRSDLRGLRAGLNHLLVILRAQGVVNPQPISMTPVAQELRRFDEYMDNVCALASKTRNMSLRIVRRLLTQRFGEGNVNIAAITPEHVRRFFVQQSKLYSKPVNANIVVATLRSYFRYRARCGDVVHGLIGAVSYPANWQLASLPKSLTTEEVQRLENSLGQTDHPLWRADAIVRCALDLGLRSCEIAKLSLDDIDWHSGTIALRHTKNQREDVLPLPMATGQAIVAYLQNERPKTSQRAVFVRRHAPLDKPIGPDLVRKAIRQAYERAGLPYTRSHLLRHTMASRLLQGGSSLKEVADVLRHRSLHSTLIYAKLDSRNLREVALPWPGSAT